MCQKFLAFFIFLRGVTVVTKKREAEEEEEEKIMSKNPPPPPPTTTTTTDEKKVGFTADRRGAPTRALQRAFKKARCAAASKSSSSFRGAP